MMCLPGLGGQWLDGQWGTKFLGLAGFALGLAVGMMYLINATKAAEAKRKATSRTRDKH
jgi:hypothetical protein